ncbi:MAG: sulfatase-like hydrolase/transferase [Pseudomonadota bacterium]
MQKKIADFFHQKNSAVNFFLVFLLLCCVYRCYFLFSVPALAILTRRAAFSSLALGLLDDLAMAFILAALIAGIQLLFQRLSSVALFRWLGKAVLCLLLLLFALDFFANIKVFFIFFTGCTYSLFQSSLQLGFTPPHYIEVMNFTDWILVLFPAVVFLALEQWASFKTTVYLNRGLMLFILISFCAGYFGLRHNNLMYINEFFKNPIHYAADNYFNPAREYYATRFEKPGVEQMHSLRLIDPAFGEATTMPATLPTHAKKQWNIIFIVLESAGMPYVFNSLDPKIVPMPFFKSLSTKGLWLNNNYSAGNSSLLGVFSLLTGIYPSGFPDNFEMQETVHVPTVAAWLPKNYDNMFLMADDIKYFFQKSVVANGGFKQIYDFFDAAKVPANAGRDEHANEPQAANLFLEKIAKLHQPFLAVYWSNATHGPYYDYGPGQRIFPNTASRLVRYYNNLRIADQQFKRIYDYLAANKLLDNTVLVVVSDHGEGFGKHSDDWYHGWSLYQDQIRVPVLIYQPALFKPQVINALTTSIDILPTVLDAIGVNYDKFLVQGDSLWQTVPKHKYVFVYGKENELAVIDKDNIKMKIYFEEGQCRRYNLNSDPDEFHPQDCPHDAQETAIIKFRNFQPAILSDYNKLLLGRCEWLPAMKGDTKHSCRLGI